MELAMEEAGVKPEEVTYINAHGTSTHHNDLFETRAIRKAFGDAADHVLVNSTKSMVGHLLGAAGVIIALLGSQSSPYAGFHVRQSLKFTVVDILLGIISAVLFWTFLIPVACGICYAVLFVVRIICFFSICKGQAKEPPIIRSLGFLR